MRIHPPSAHKAGAQSAGAERTGRIRWVFGAFVTMAAVLLAFEHRAHLLGVLPWLFLLACPLMHLFMHHGHGGHGRHDGGPKDGGAR